MAFDGASKQSILQAIRSSASDFKSLLESARKSGDAETADAVAVLILELNSGQLESEPAVIERILAIAGAVASDNLKTVMLGTLWREDLDWLNEDVGEYATAREMLLQIVAKGSPKAVAAVFWRAVSERGPRFTAVAFNAAESTHPHEAARLLVRLCRAALAGQYDLEIRESVDSFLAKKDSSVRTSFLNEVRRMPEAEKRKLMNHLDMSLMAELDRDAIDHRGKSFFYDEEAERKKREEKGKDIFDEVRKRLERGDKPQF